VLVHDRFDLGRRDVLAAADDRVVGPPAHEQVPAGVEIALVPVENHPSSSVIAPPSRYSPATWGPARRSSASPGAHATPSDIAHQDLDRRQRLPDRAQASPHHRIGARQRRAVIVGAEYRDRGRRLVSP